MNNRTGRWIGVAACMAAGMGAAQARDLPDPVLTPGETRAVSAQALCAPGGVPEPAPRDVQEIFDIYVAYGLEGPGDGYCAAAGGCELDHLVSLGLGGADSAANLWPQPLGGEWSVHRKDRLEAVLRERVCRGDLTLAEAQAALRGDWREAWRIHVTSAAAPGPAAVAGVEYRSGGIGTGEREALRAVEDRYRLKLGFAERGRGSYVADVRVQVRDAAGGLILDVVAEGPWFLAALEPGVYRLTVTYGDQAQTRTVDLTRSTGWNWFYWG